MEHPPIWKTKYDTQGANAYRPGRHNAEVHLIDRVFASIPVCTVLDLPCGNGRFSSHLARKGYAVSAADYSVAMLNLAEQDFGANKLNIDTHQEDIERLTFADQSFDTVLCFRLFHHFPDSLTRTRAVSELCRVAHNNVVISYFSPFSVTSIKNGLRAKFGGKKSKKYSTPLSELKKYFASHGFELHENNALMPFIHTIHVAVFRRLCSSGTEATPAPRNL